MSSGFKSILIAGSTGYVGEIVTNVFLKSPTWSVSILVNPESLKDAKKKPTFDKYVSLGAKLIQADISKPDTYKHQLAGIDVILSALGVAALTHQATLARAAKEAGVKLFVPSEYGLDVSKFEGNPVFTHKIEARKEIEKIGIDHIYIETGAFFEYLLAWPAWGVDVKNKKVTLIHTRSTRIAAAPFEEVAQLLPAALNDPANINTPVRFGYPLTAGEIFDEAVAALGGKDKVETKTDTIPEIEARIAANPNLANSFGDWLLLALASERGFSDQLIDGSRYGKRLPTFKEFAPAFVPKVANGTFSI